MFEIGILVMAAKVGRYNLNTDFWFPVAAGVFVAVISVTISEYRQARRNSRLRFREVDMQIQMKGPDAGEVVWRLPVTNVGSRPALELTGEVSMVEDNGVARVGLVTAPLNWRHNPREVFIRSVFRSQIAYLDVCQWALESEARPILSNSPVMGIRDSNELPNDSVRLRIDFFQQSGQRIEVWIKMKLCEPDFRSSSVLIESVTRYRRVLFFEWPTIRRIESDVWKFSGTW